MQIIYPQVFHRWNIKTFTTNFEHCLNVSNKEGKFCKAFGKALCIVNIYVNELLALSGLCLCVHATLNISLFESTFVCWKYFSLETYIYCSAAFFCIPFCVLELSALGHVAYHINSIAM